MGPKLWLAILIKAYKKFILDLITDRSLDCQGHFMVKIQFYIFYQFKFLNFDFHPLCH